MSEVYYTVSADGYGVPRLWRHDGPDDPRPYPVDHGDVLRAAEMVYAPDPIIENLVVRAIDDPEAYIDADKVPVNGSLDHQAQAVLAALRDHATGGGTDGV